MKLSILAIFFLLAACGNGNGGSSKTDTLQPAAPGIQQDTLPADTLVNNGERVNGRDTTGRKQ